MKSKFIFGLITALMLVGCSGTTSSVVPTSSVEETSVQETTSQVEVSSLEESTSVEEEVSIRITSKIDLYSDLEHTPYNTTDQKAQMTGYLIKGNEKRGCCLVIPGGGYVSRSEPKEGSDTAKYLCQKLHMNCFVVHYRERPTNFRGFTNDVLRAIKMVKQNADDYNIDSSHIALVGFSAGGQLSMVTQEHYDESFYGWNDDPVVEDELDAVSAKVDALCLGYPGCSISYESSDDHTHANRFLADENTEEMRQKYITWLNVRDDTCPVFIHQAKDDTTVDISYTYQLEEALKDKNITVESHYFEKGEHGYACTEVEDTSQWVTWFKTFLEDLGF